jgi:hypothetical protein
VVHGRLFGMVQGKANQWIHVLLPALLAALRALGDAPARSLTALAQRLGVSEADAAAVVVPLEEPAPVAPIPAAAPAAPLLPMTGPNGVSSAPKTLRNRPRVIVGRKRRWCPSIACMQYAQRAHACWTLPKPGTRSTSGVRYGVRQLPQSSGDGGLRSVCRSAEIASRDVRPSRR